MLSGNLANQEARGVILIGIIEAFQAVQLVFAWTRNDDVPLILGQVNFFMTFDVCFFRTDALFEITQK